MDDFLVLSGNEAERKNFRDYFRRKCMHGVGGLGNTA